MDLTTIARVKARLSITGATHDALLTQLVGEASALAADFLDREVEVQSGKVEILDVHETEPDQIFQLDAYPVSAITRVTYDLDGVFPTSDDLDTDDWMLVRGGETGQLRIRARLSAGSGSLRVQYDGGMAADTDAFIAAFPGITSAVDTQVAYMYQRRREIGVTSVSGQAGSVVHFDQGPLLKAVKRALQRHRRVA